MTVPAVPRPPTPPKIDAGDAAASRRLRWAVVMYVLAVLAHGADHVRRGVDAVTTQVRSAGQVQLVLALVVLGLVLRRHGWAPAAAAALGFTSALLFVAVHFVPYWGSFSDAFTGRRVGPDVTALSWVAAIVEVAAGIVLGWTGMRALNRSASLS
jgi:hypothetical protein